MEGPHSEASKLLEAALEQMDGIIQGAKYEIPNYAEFQSGGGGNGRATNTNTATATSSSSSPSSSPAATNGVVVGKADSAPRKKDSSSSRRACGLSDALRTLRTAILVRRVVYSRISILMMLFVSGRGKKNSCGETKRRDATVCPDETFGPKLTLM